MRVRANQGSFESGERVAASLLRLRAGDSPVQVGTGTAANDGSADIELTIPSDSPPGVYVAYLEGTASASPRVFAAPLVVRGGAGSVPPASSGSPSGSVAAPAALQPLAPLQPAEEAAAVENAIRGAKPFLLPDGRVEMRLADFSRSPSPAPSPGPAAPLVVVAALLAGWGMLRLRRPPLAAHRR